MWTASVLTWWSRKIVRKLNFLLPGDVVAPETSSCKVTKINKAVVEMGTNFSLVVDGGNMEELTERVPEKMSSEERLGLEQELLSIAEEEAREKEAAGEKEKELQENPQ